MIGIVLLIAGIYLFNQGKFNQALLIYFLLITNGFQLIPVNILMVGTPLDKASDLAIFFTLFVFITQVGQISKIINAVPISKLFIYLFVFILIDAFYSIIILEYSIVNVLQVLRPYLLLLSISVFVKVPLNQLIKLFHTLAIITIIQSVLFLMQIITGQTILLSISGTSNVAINQIQGMNYTRFYNTPIFLIPTIFYFLFVYKYQNKLKHILILSILILTIIGPMHRSAIMAFIAVNAIFILLRQSFSKGVFYLAIVGLIVYASSFVDIISSRMDEGLEDIASTFSTKMDTKSIDISENTTIFRIGHFLERFDYISNTPFGWMFGVGLISDNASYASKLPFEFGLRSEATGQIVQIDTADLIWSPLILTLGVVGTLLYVLVYFRVMRFFFNEININQYSIVGFLTILYSFFVSMMSTYMLESSFRVLIILLIIVVIKIKQDIYCKNILSSTKIKV